MSQKEPSPLTHPLAPADLLRIAPMIYKTGIARLMKMPETVSMAEEADMELDRN